LIINGRRCFTTIAYPSWPDHGRGRGKKEGMSGGEEEKKERF